MDILEKDTQKSTLSRSEAEKRHIFSQYEQARQVYWRLAAEAAGTR